MHLIHLVNYLIHALHAGCVGCVGVGGVGIGIVGVVGIVGVNDSVPEPEVLLQNRMILVSYISINGNGINTIMKRPPFIVKFNHFP